MTTTSSSPAGRTFFARNLEHFGMAALCVAVLLPSALFVEGFATAQNASGLLLTISTIGILCCSMLLCLASGDFDLSVGSVVAFSGVLAVEVANRNGSLAAGVLAGLGAGAAVGLINGYVVAFLRINPLITTLATMQAARGLAYIVGDGKTVSPAPAVAGFKELGGSFKFAWGDGILAIGYPVVVMAVCLLIFAVLLHLTVFGRSVLALGGNEEAARLAGIPVRRTRLLVFVIQGVMAGRAGVLLAARLQVGDPKAGVGLELQVISACVLGGVALTGGRGTILSIIWGMLILGAVQRAMDLQQVGIYWQYLISGGILMAAVILDRFKNKLA